MGLLTRLARLILNACKLPEETPPRMEQSPEPLTVHKVVITYESREQLEARAACILSARGARGDVWGHVRGLTNRDLIKIINEGY